VSKDFPILHEANFFQELANFIGPCLIAFSSPFCGACQRLKSLIETNKSNRSWSFPIFLLDAGENPGLVQNYEIFHFPTLLLFKDGAYHAEIQCLLSIDHIQEAVDQALKETPQQEP
jgi:thioredoxin 1